MESSSPSSVQRERILITVLTYPHPSESYDELVCTAGLTQRGEWVRLYPIDYRYRPKEQQFRKYQWIEVDVEARGSGNDNRKESRRPRLDTIRVLGEPITTNDDWRARRQIIDSVPHSTLGELEASYNRDHTSLGILRPDRILDLKVEPADREWKGSWQDVQNQLRLFDAQPKKLEKLPFKWSYVFTCPDRAALFLKLRDAHGEDKAAQMVRDHYLGVVAGSTRDVQFFMGTRFPYNTWLIVGVFWPPKKQQLDLGLA